MPEILRKEVKVANDIALEKLDISAARVVSLEFTPELRQEKIAGIVNSIGLNLSSDSTPIVHFTSAYDGEGADKIAMEVAYAEAMADRRVLFLDCGADNGQGALSALAGQVEVLFDAFLRHGNVDAGSPFVNLEGTSFFYGCVAAQPSLAFSASFSQALSERLKGMFDLVVICSQAGLSNTYIPAFSKIADGSVIVVEAERTRAPVLKELVQMVETNGGHVIGTVLSGQRFYIPRMLYSLLFKS